MRRFENYVALLTTIHLDCGPARDWKANVIAAPPLEPMWVESESREAIARSALASYRPGFFEKLLGAHTGVISRLETAVYDARAADRDEWERALTAHREALEAWSTQTRLTQGVLRLELNACRAALEQAGAFDELRTLRATVGLAAIEQAHAKLVHRIEDPEVVPRTEVALAASEKVAVRDMAAARRDVLFKEHVCSCALRIAREVFAALPVAGVSVHAELSRREAGGAQPSPTTILGVQFERTAFGQLNFDAIQPSAAIANFRHRMSFHSAIRLGVVEPRQDTTECAAPGAVTVHDPSPPTSPHADNGCPAGGTDRAATVPAEPADALREADRDPESQFRVWLAVHVGERASAQFKVKTLVNQLGRFRADRRLSFKAVRDLAGVLSSAGYEAEPDLEAMDRSPGIEARVRVSRKLSPEQHRAKAFRDAAPSLALLRFLWGAGYHRLRLSTTVRPRADDPSVETAQELVERVRRASSGGLAVLEYLIVTGALENWLLDAQRNAVLATVAAGLRRDAEPRKAERWLADAARLVKSQRARR